MIQFNMPWEFKFPLRKNKVYFGEGRKRSKRGDGIMKRSYRTRAAPKGRRRRPTRKGQRGRGFSSSLKKQQKIFS